VAGGFLTIIVGLKGWVKPVLASVGGTKLTKLVPGLDAEQGLMYTGMVSGLFGVAMEGGVATELFFVTVGPDELDDGTQPTSAIVKGC
jgi:hypothetical protein